MNVLLYVKLLIDHTKIKTFVYFSTMITYSLSIMTDFFTLISSYVLVMKGKGVLVLLLIETEYFLDNF